MNYNSFQNNIKHFSDKGERYESKKRRWNFDISRRFF